VTLVLIHVILQVNGELRQEGNTEDMIFPLAFLISHLSETFTLEAGDLLLTGTPEGVGPVRSGDLLTCGLTGVAEMAFTVA
jgi:2-keto-4-pentenoate hydratase/2-oxohepta-3-ene-1,7-dioic acid hydratase in catechol pathway